MQNVEPYKLLIVDDESGIRDSLKDFFELEGFYVESSDSGKNALELVKKKSFDLVLSDIRMPEGDGRFLLQSIRLIHRAHPVVILMSGFSDVTPEEAYAEGAVALLTKPFNPVEVMEKIKLQLANLENKWSSHYDSQPKYQLNINANSLEEAIAQNNLSCGQNGFFIKMDPSGYRVGQDIEFKFSDASLSGIGTIRWVRTNETHNRIKGMGIELRSLSDKLKTQFLNVIENQTISSVIPIG